MPAIPRTISFKEFVGLMALLVSLTALSIDTMLPALHIIGEDLKVTNPNHAQYIISFLFLGFTFGQILFGPLSDSMGRKASVYIGVGIFMAGSALSLFAVNFPMMLAGRLLQGIGVAAPRIASMAITRDLYAGREMARVMSFVMAVFILVPVLAPAVGQLIIAWFHWRSIFVFLMAVAAVVMLWMYLRLPETLHEEDRRPFRLHAIWQGALIVFRNPSTVGYTICAGLVFGALIGYLSMAQQIFQDYYHAGDAFALYFAVSALSIGIASIVNSAIVRKYGMRRIVHGSLIGMLCTTGIFFLCAMQETTLPLWQFLTFICSTFFCLGLLFGNLNAIAMEPMGHVAGIASAVIGSSSSLISLVLGTIIGQAYNMTLLPLAIGFLSLTIVTFILEIYLHKKYG